MGTNGFKVKTETEWFIVICSRCRHNLKSGDFTLLFCGVRQRNARKFVLHVQHEYFSFLTNNILALWRCRSRRLCLNFLMTSKGKRNLLRTGCFYSLVVTLSYVLTVDTHQPHGKSPGFVVSRPDKITISTSFAGFFVRKKHELLFLTVFFKIQNGNIYHARIIISRCP